MIAQGECAQFHVRLFGTPGVSGPNGPVKLSPQQTALVALVYGHGPVGIARSRSTRLLWGAEATSEARHRLRQLLVEIRRRVGSRIIETSGDVLKPSVAVASDLVAFERALSNGSLLDAALVARSGFAALESGSIAEAYHDWASATAISHDRRLRVQALSRWRLANAEGDWPTAKDAAEALHALDPAQPDSVMRMIEVLANCGQPESAEKIFVEYTQGLSTEARPVAGVVEAIDRARRLRKVRATVLGPAQDDVPLIGRRDAIAQARSIFDDVQQERIAFLLIAGESGIGKTRVLRELHREAVLRDIRCLEAQAVELECRIPLNPLLDALKSVELKPHLRDIGPPWNAVIGAMLPTGTLDGPAAAPPPIQESALTRRLLDAFSLLFESLASEQPTLLFLDDLQWADATTISALQFMQRRWSRGAFGIVASVRPDLVAPDDPVAKYLAARSDGIGITRIDLSELSTDAALHLVEIIGNGEIGDELAQRICALAGLHPLYLTELARDYLAGRLRLPELPVREVTIPVSLKQILDARLRYLSTEGHKLANVLAVAARPVRLSDAARLVGLDLDEAADAVDELRRARLIECDRDRVFITHELFRSAIYRTLSEPRRAISHRAVAELVEQGSGPEAAGELAIHFARAGETERASQYAWTAAERAMDAGAVSEAAHFFQLAAESETDLLRRAEATAAQAKALHLSRDIHRATPLLEVAAARLHAVGRRSEALRLDIKRVEGLAEVGAASLPDLYERLAQIKALARAADDWEGAALALDVELRIRARDGDVDGVKTLFEELREIVASGDTDASAIAHACLAMGLFFGDPEEALRSGLIGVQMSEGGPANTRLVALNRLIIVMYHRGVLDHASSRPFVDEALELAERSGDRLQRYSLESNIAAQHMDAGNLERADLLLKRASRLFGSADMPSQRVNHAFNVGELALAKGDFSRAEASFKEANELLGKPKPRYTSDFVNAGMGLCALESGAVASARRREEALSDGPATWYFDPTTIVAFRTRMLALRGYHDQALDLLRLTAVDLDGRLCLAWLKIKSLEARLLRTRSPASAREIAAMCVAKAEDLQLHNRAQEFTNLLESIARRCR